jgi:hypothetical protein
MLYPLYLLVSDADSEWRIEATRHRVWRPTLVVPRHLCLFESLPCGEVRLHELAGFVRLQIQRLSPFARAGASAVRRGGRLILWIWDADEVEAAVRASGLSEMRFRVMAESLFVAAPTDGAVIERGTQSVAQGMASQGALLKSEVVSLHALDLASLLQRPWARDWAGLGRGGAPADWQSRLRRAFNIGVASMVFAMLALAGFHYGALHGGRRAVEELDARLAQEVAERGELSAVAKAAQRDRQWIDSYSIAARQIDVEAVLDTLRPVLERQGVVIRELEVGTTDIKLVLATAGGEIRLPELLMEMNRVAGLRDVQLIQHNELAQATFGFQAPGFQVDPMQMAGAATLGAPKNQETAHGKR